MENKILEFEEKMDSLREEISSLLEINSKYECENEDLKIELKRLHKKLKYTFNVETLYDEMKYETLKEAFEKIPLEVIQSKLDLN